MKIRRISVPIMRDTVEVTSPEVGEHEARVLAAVHGPDRVNIDAAFETGESVDIESSEQEYQRLAHVYGRDPETRRLYVDEAFGTPAQFARELAEMAGEPEPAPVQTGRRSRAAAQATA